MASPAAPGARPGQSCDLCSRRRLRCDRGWPCGLCAERGRACTYAREVRKRGPKPAAGRAADGNAVKQVAPAAGGPIRGAGAVRRVGGPAGELATAQVGAPAGGRLPPGAPHAPPLEPGGPFGTAVARWSPLPPSPGSDSSSGASPGPVLASNPLFAGAFAALAGQMPANVQAHIAPPHVPASTPPFYPGAHPAPLFRPLVPSLPRHLTLADDLPPLPDPGVLRYLVDAYFLTIGTTVPIFHRPTFTASLAQQPLFLIWTMAAIALPFLPHGVSSGSPLSRKLLAAMPADAHTVLRPATRRALQTNLVERAKRALLRVAEATALSGPDYGTGEQFRIAKMGGLVLLGMVTAFRFYKGAIEFTDAVNRLATEEARALGLNLPRPMAGHGAQPAGGWIADETARRLWYAMFIADQVAAMGLNRPPSVGHGECLAPAPISDAAFAADGPESPAEQPIPAALVFDNPDAPSVRADGVLVSEWAMAAAAASTLAAVVDWQRQSRMKGVQFFLPRTEDTDPAWEDCHARFLGLAAMLERLYWKFPAWLRDLDADPAGFLADLPSDIAAADPAAVAKAVHAIAMLHAAQCCLHSPPAPAAEHRETRAWMAHGHLERPNDNAPVMVAATASARRAGRTAFAGFPLAPDPSDPSGFLTSPAALCFFHQRRRAALSRHALMPLDPDVVFRDGLQGIAAIQVFMLRLLLRGMYAEEAVGRLAGEFVRDNGSGRAPGPDDASELLRRAQQEGDREFWSDLHAHLAEMKPGGTQHRAGAAGLHMTKVILASARLHTPGEGSFAGLRYSTIGALGGEFKEMVMRRVLSGPDRAEPGVEEGEEEGGAQAVL
ncbi:hypothetical protein DFJ74DRAFT_767480 [Hyaloraphidium curvatum]|nr:hypothetical protein DFJ74DRAFT_767480 [Hyaloraphidium curvatum]